MSESTSSVPPGGPAAAKHPAGAGGKLLAFLGWLALLCGIAVFAVVTFVRSEHRADGDRRFALTDSQRSVAAAAATLAEDLAAGAIPAAAHLSALRIRSLELLARVPPDPAGDLRGDLQAEWRRLATGLDAIEAERARLVMFRTELEALRASGRALREISDRIVDLVAREGGPARQEAETLAVAARQFAGEVDRASLTDPARLDRARGLLEFHARVRGFVATEIARPLAVAIPRADRSPALYTDMALAAVESEAAAAGERLDAARGAAAALAPLAMEIRRLGEAATRVTETLPDFVARGTRVPVFLGASLDAWLLRSAALALAGLLGLLWRRQRLLRGEAAALDRAWAEAAGSDWRARSHLRDLLRAVNTLDRRPANAVPIDDEDLEGRVREATASLPRIVARRSQLAAVLLSARRPLRERLAAARDSVLAHLGPGGGDLDTAPLLEIETTFREATLFAMAALLREIRAVASGGANRADENGPPTRSENDAETLHGVAARGFDLLELSLERVLAGEEETRAALIFLLDDLRVVRGKAPFSSSLDFSPELERPAAVIGPKDGRVLQADAARMLPSFRKGLAEWSAAGGDGGSAAKLVRGSVSVLARAAEEGMSPARTFWSAAAAFSTALAERAVPAGPAVRRLVDEVARAFEETATREDPPAASDRLLRELLIYIALAESDHAELAEVRAAFELERFPLAVPEHPGERGAREGETAVPEEIIEQLEGIRAALDRIDAPFGTASRPPPSH